jgi:PPP family 3-phenylpropionic acid transporter
MALLRSSRNPENVPLLTTKSFYFLFYAAAASLIPFLVIYYEQLGFSGRQIGFLAAIPPLVILISAPVWGAAADATKQHKRLLMIAITGALLAVFLFSRTTAFAWIIPVIVVYAFFAAPVIPMVDASTMAWLGEERNLYGRIRLWGAIGWGLSAPLIGWLIERSTVRWAFYGYIVLMLGGVVVAWFLPIRETSAQQSFWSSVRVFAGNKQWLLFLAGTFTGGMCMAIISNFLFLYMNDLGASKTMMGLSLTFATLSELPIFFYSNRLINRWGARGLMLIALLAYIVRALAYTVIFEPWMFLAVQLLHGLTFSAMWVAGVSYADSMAPEGLGATAQGIFSSVLLGLGGIAGGLIGGIIYDELGAVAMFRWAAASALLGLVIFALFSRTPTPKETASISVGGNGNDTNGW